MKNYADLIADAENIWDLLDDEEFYIDTKYVDGEKLEYEIIFGNNNIVFIKTGAGGSARGYKNKYFQMAKRVHERIGATVICASNPDVPHVNFDEQEIRRVASKRGFKTFHLYLWGISDGAYQNLSLAKRFPKTEKWIGVNSSFITFDDFEEKLQDLDSVKKIDSLLDIEEEFVNSLKDISIMDLSHFFTISMSEILDDSNIFNLVNYRVFRLFPVFSFLFSVSK
jgi:pimeloyl-ACP methyl ester carboxylesterase